LLSDNIDYTTPFRFIYELYEESKLPWVYGGEYKAFSACVESVVKAWMAVGLRVYFVFDGMSLCLFIVAHLSDPLKRFCPRTEDSNPHQPPQSLDR
jgi:hypothetical protein